MRVLIVSYYFPPSNAIGAQRPGALAEHLRVAGDDVRVLSCSAHTGHSQLETFEGLEGPADATEPGVAVSETGWRRSSVLRRLSEASSSLRHRPDGVRDWRRESLRIAQDDLTHWRPEIVVSSSPPPSAHLIARSVARNLGVPWIPDYRDLWSNSTYYPYQRWRKSVDRVIESRYLRDAKAITAATPTFSRELRPLAGKAPVLTIMNGYSQAELASIPAQNLGAGWHLAYAGTWYGSKRDPEPVMRAMRDRAELSDVVLHFVGPVNEAVNHLAEEYGIIERVHSHGVLPRTAALGVVKGADSALLLSWNDPRDAGVVSGKLYEYIGLQRPILALGYANGLIAKILRDTGLGYLVNDPDGISEALCSIRLGLGPSGPFDFRAGLTFERTTQIAAWAELIRRQSPEDGSQ